MSSPINRPFQHIATLARSLHSAAVSALERFPSCTLGAATHVMQINSGHRRRRYASSWMCLRAHRDGWMRIKECHARGCDSALTLPHRSCPGR